MKKINRLLLLPIAFQDMATNYTPGATPSGRFQNANMNPVGSQYAAAFGHDVSTVLNKVVRSIIYDAAPKQYLDLKILSLKTPERTPSDEFFYNEASFGRDPILCDTIGGGGIAAGATQSIPILNKNNVSKDMIIIYSGNERGTITSVTPSGAGATIVVTAETGEVLPAIPAGAAGANVFAYLSPVEADGMSDISNYVRYDTIERSNYVQMLVKAMRFGKMELAKYQGTSNLSGYIEFQKKVMYRQFRTSLGNIFWNGHQAEVTLANGLKAKTAGGVFPIMQQAGSAHTSVTLANAPGALEELALSTEYGEHGATRFFFATPRVIHYLSDQYKRDLTRYTPNDSIARLGLSGIDMGSSNIVFVPVKRFEEPSCFPSSWRSKGLLVDMESITPKYVFPEEMGDTLKRVNGGNLQNYVDSWISATTSIEFNNPLASGWIDITNLP